jgi:hypothetical protein
MFKTSIVLTNQLMEAHFRELLADADRERAVTFARAAQVRTRRTGIAAARAGLATLLLRAASWLMPPGALQGCQRPVAFGLRTSS